MELDYEQIRDGFIEQSEVFLKLVNEAEDLSAPTTLGDWDCAVLIGHVSTAIEALFRWQGDPSPADVEVDVVGWLVGAEEASELNDDFSKRYAAKRSHQQIRDLVAAAVEKANETVADTAAGASLIAPLPGSWVRFDQLLASRVLELTVHGSDLAAAIGSSIAPSSVAASVVGWILDELLDGDRPGDLADDTAWMLAATGRSEHADRRLPVMG